MAEEPKKKLNSAAMKDMKPVQLRPAMSRTRFLQGRSISVSDRQAHSGKEGKHGIDDEEDVGKRGSGIPGNTWSDR